MSWTKLVFTGLTVAAVLTIWATYQVWAAAFLGVLFALSLNGLAEWIRHYVPLPTRLATVLAMVIVFASVAGLGWLMGPSLVRQIDDLTSELPEATQSVLSRLDQSPWGQRILKYVEDVTGVSPDETMRQAGYPLGEGEADPDNLAASDKTREMEEEGAAEDDSQDETESRAFDFGNLLRSVAGALSLTAKTGTLLMVTFVVTVFVALDPNVYTRGVLWLVPTRHEEIARTTLDRLRVAMRWWMIGRLASMAAVGVLTSLGMWLIGMPAPMALGMLAALLSFVPNIGPIVASLPGLLLALAQGPWMVMAALGVYIVAQIIETNMVTPLIEQYVVSVPPGVLIVTQLVIATLAGVWGMIVATPLLVVVMVLVQQLYVRQLLQKPIEVTGST
jgi:predicted PurR-regulated permease PerM